MAQRNENGPGFARGAPIVICGLGNPGRKYAKNRHNAGFQCLDRLATEWGLCFQRMRFKAYVEETRFADHKIILAKPLTFMNDSGESVAPLVHWYKVPEERLLVIYDDLDLPLGTIRLRPEGSDGGHKGMRSIIRQLGTQDFPRLRIGIGRPEWGEPYQYVLNDFSADQVPVMEETYEVAVEAIECFIQQGIKAAMNTFNGQVVD
jgi:PTH1 family peptidyl-tRNA hydrolase